MDVDYKLREVLIQLNHRGLVNFPFLLVYRIQKLSQQFILVFILLNELFSISILKPVSHFVCLQADDEKVVQMQICK